ncbi:unnamed protein product [Peronospora belbahrii]|uniref:Reverse transcriptase RNase H-like domain-containing protein n=1 Tax=Peronospora belbahrii TaxID=622444 RepID=A0ABN8CM14_9STRA|nr:unnamed protein product [Peronospora belbahrii]
MRLIKFRVYSLGKKVFSVYTDHASLGTAVKTPHLSQRMARWLSFFSEYNFVVLYKPGKNNILADALFRRPDYDPDATWAIIQVVPLTKTMIFVCAELGSMQWSRHLCCQFCLMPLSEVSLAKLTKRTGDNIKRYALDGPLLTYTMDAFDPPRVVTRFLRLVGSICRWHCAENLMIDYVDDKVATDESHAVNFLAKAYQAPTRCIPLRLP